MFLVLFILWSINIVEGANILIQTFGCISGNKCGCNENITIMCTITPYQQVLYWTADGQTIAQCSPSACVGFEDKYHYDFDVTSGRSNLTFSPLRLDDQGIVFECNEATTDKAQFTPLVDVDVDENDFNTDGTSESASISSKGCISSADSISVEWMVSRTDHLTNDAYNFETTFKKTQNKTNVACTNAENQNCGGNTTSKISASILIPNNADTPHYVFAVVKQNGKDDIIFRMTGTYNISKQCSADQFLCDNVCMAKCDCPMYKNTSECKGTWCSETDNECNAGILGIFAGICFVMVCITGIKVFYDKYRNEVNAEKTESENQPTDEESMKNHDQSHPIELRDSRYRSFNH